MQMVVSHFVCNPASLFPYVTVTAEYSTVIKDCNLMRNMTSLITGVKVMIFGTGDKLCSFEAFCLG